MEGCFRVPATTPNGMGSIVGSGLLLVLSKDPSGVLKDQFAVLMRDMKLVYCSVLRRPMTIPLHRSTGPHHSLSLTIHIMYTHVETHSIDTQQKRNKPCIRERPPDLRCYHTTITVLLLEAICITCRWMLCHQRYKKKKKRRTRGGREAPVNSYFAGEAASLPITPCLGRCATTHLPHGDRTHHPHHSTCRAILSYLRVSLFFPGN